MKRKIVLMSETDRAAFLRFCEAVKNMEVDKDTFLKASRLERRESASKLTGEQQYWLAIVKTWAGVIGLLVVGIFIKLIIG